VGRLFACFTVGDDHIVNACMVAADAYVKDAYAKDTAVAVACDVAEVWYKLMKPLGNHVLWPNSTELMNPFIFKGFGLTDRVQRCHFAQLVRALR
jgi:hypothetical protein